MSAQKLRRLINLPMALGKLECQDDGSINFVRMRTVIECGVSVWGRQQIDEYTERLWAEIDIQAAEIARLRQCVAERDAFADSATEAQAERDAARSQCDRQAVEITALETAVSEASAVIADRNAQITRLRAALNINAQALAWRAFGECRGFDAPVASADVAIAAARAALEP